MATQYSENTITNIILKVDIFMSTFNEFENVSSSLSIVVHTRKMSYAQLIIMISHNLSMTRP